MEFYYNHNGEIIGPIPINEMNNYPIEAETLVWMEGMPNWLPAGSVPEFQPLFAHLTPPANVRAPRPQDLKPEDPAVRKAAEHQRLEQATNRNYKRPTLILGLASLIMIVISVNLSNYHYYAPLGFFIFLGTAIAGFIAFKKSLEASKERVLGNYREALDLQTSIKQTLIFSYIAFIIGIICCIWK